MALNPLNSKNMEQLALKGLSRRLGQVQHAAVWPDDRRVVDGRA